MGNVQHDQTCRVRATLGHALIARQLVSPGAKWLLLDGGRTNTCWRVIDEDRDMVVKLFAKGDANPLFPNNPENEIALLRDLAGQGIAPSLLDAFETLDGHCVVYRHLSGMPWQSDTKAVSILLARLHRTPPPSGLRRAPDGSEDLIAQTEMILRNCPGGFAERVAHLRPVGHIPASGTLALLHGDPVPGNIIFSGIDWKLIDWQCPAVGDPCEDISIFLSPAMQLAYRGRPLDPGETHAFLEGYGNPDITARYCALAPWYHWRMLAYCLWLESRGDPGALFAAKLEAACLMPA